MVETTTLASGVRFITISLTIAIICAVLFLFILVKKRFNVRTVIYEQTGAGLKITFKNAKKRESLEGNHLSFLFSKKVMPLPPSNHFFLMGNNKYLLNIYKNKEGEYHSIPMKWTEENNPLLVPDNTEMNFWLVNHLKEAERVYAEGGFWAKYGNLIIIGATLAFAMVTIIVYGHYFFTGIQESAGALSGSMTGLQETLQNALTGGSG